MNIDLFQVETILPGEGGVEVLDHPVQKNIDMSKSY